MSLKVMDFETPAGNPATPQSAPNLDPALLAVIQNAANDAAMQATKQAHEVSARMTAGAMAAVEKRLAGLETPKPQIMAISIDQHVTKLDAPLTPYSAKILGKMIVNAKLGLNTLLVGPAGCGKTTYAQLLANSLGLSFHGISWTAGMAETPVIMGRENATGKVESPVSKAYRLGGVVLHDEIDNADANALGIINRKIANGHFFNTIMLEEYARHPDFVCVAGANTCGKGADFDSVYVGRNRLDGATLDRFVKLAVTYDAEFERQACPDATLYKLLSNARAKLAEIKSAEIISTRAFQSCYKLLQAGRPGQEILEDLTLGWSSEVITACKLDSYPASKQHLDAFKALDAAVGIPHAVKPDVDAQIDVNEKRIAELKAKLAAASRG